MHHSPSSGSIARRRSPARRGPIRSTGGPNCRGPNSMTRFTPRRWVTRCSSVRPWMFKLMPLMPRRVRCAGSFFTGGPVRLAPSVENGRVYAGSDDGNVYCLGADDGRLIWRFQVAPESRDVVGGGAGSFTGERPGGFINIIPAGGVVVQPEAGSGCSCHHAIQYTVVFKPVGKRGASCADFFPCGSCRRRRRSRVAPRTATSRFAMATRSKI